MVNKEKNDVLQITISKEIYRLIKKEAGRCGLSAAGYARMILLQYLEEHAGRR